ncbi:carboxylesterase 3B [Lingula anatina]|uniref:Carboxylic ester hydrolase n=1 Tax=Lingula anatina TaxID=7574 RepID=A0A1S3JET1_LINAN|nr:carboxylesterase 3B [Lingula anatina]XP_013408923.1 carboxylesterase 3B [Lingula anatina]XP_013408924.1 carboxylesterase 3B [Lingula anatina]XP_023932163.1 carboxylesterase 3B [Lingula anatina]|eukprot:XP_013408922.1 carboxylesterase 3B [Lingula anatina]
MAAYIQVLAALLMVVFTGSHAEILETKLGKIRGKTETVNGKKINVYLGIPYAEPPLGYLRFRKPVPKKPWTRMLDATEYGPSCIQNLLFSLPDILRHTDISEDCLSLNAYVPVSENKSPKAVMVWIHGGGYDFGQALTTPCEELALHGDVICVTINYRLNLFGFLTTLDENAPSNIGLWDQHEALKWVKEHISTFGGDPESITIFGESAGGSSVQHQAVTKYNIGLVKRAISQSPPTFSNGFAFAGNPLRLAKELALKLNCNTSENRDLSDTLQLVNCLRLVPAEVLLNTSSELLTPGPTNDVAEYGNMPFAPVEDGDFVPYGTKEYFSASKTRKNPEINEAFSKVDWMVGALIDEGNSLLYVAAMTQEDDGYNISSGIPENVVNTNMILPFLKTLFPNSLDIVKRHIHDAYTHKDDPIENSLAMCDFFTDIIFHQHVVEACMAHLRSKSTSNAQKSATYSYIISHALSGRNVMEYYFGFSLPTWAKTATHGDDLPLVFGTKILKEGVEFDWNEQDEKTAKVVRTFWTNFAKTGNPNQGLPLESMATWEEFTKDKKGYINIGKQTEMKYDLHHERMKLWMYTIPEEIEKEQRNKQKTEL